MDEKSSHLTRNHILAALPEADLKRLLPHFETVELRSGDILYEMGGPIKYVYFPFNALISLVTQMVNGAIVEVGLIGNEGMSGLVAILGKEISPERAIVQIPNGAARAKLKVIKEEFQRGKELQQTLFVYARKLMRQVSQTAACNATHTAEERLSRWLLMCHDRVDSTELKLTQEFIAEMLGTRRATVSVAAMVLQSEGYLQYHRGNIKIIDRQGLEKFTCECYRALKDSE